MTEKTETADSAPILSFFWDLAVPDLEKREEACVKLLSYLQKDESDAGDSAFPGCSRDLVYSINRLVKGLMSYRDCSRQGFALALTYLLENLNKVSTSSVYDLMEKTFTLNNNLRKQQERDILFGKLFGFLALIKSKRVTNEPEFAGKILGELNTLFPSKQYLNELSIHTYTLIAESLNDEQFKSIFIPSVFSLYHSDLHTLTSSTSLLSLFLFVQYTLQQRHIKLEGQYEFFTTAVFTKKNAHSLRLLYKRSTFYYPMINSLYVHTFNLIFSQDITPLLHCQREKSIDQNLTALMATRTTSPSASGYKDPSLTEEQSEMLSFVFDALFDPILYSSRTTKATILRIVASILCLVPVSSLHLVLTQPIMSLLYSNICKKESYLNSLAVYTAKMIKYEGLQSLERQYEILDLLVNRCNVNFDRFTRMNVVTDLIITLDKSKLSEYMLYLIKVLVNPQMGKTNFLFGHNDALLAAKKTEEEEEDEEMEEEEEEEQKEEKTTGSDEEDEEEEEVDEIDTASDSMYNDKKRAWCLDSIYTFSQSSSFSNENDYYLAVLTLFIMIGYCPLIQHETSEDMELSLTSDSIYNYLTKSLTLSFTQQLIESCRNKFNTFCTYLIHLDNKQTHTGLIPEPFWLYKCVNLYVSIRDRYMKDYSEDTSVIDNINYVYITKPIEDEADLFKITDDFIKKGTQDKNRYTMIVMLLNIYLCILNDYNDDDLFVSLNDCIQCYNHMYDSDLIADDSEESPIAVLLDLCINLLIYNSKRLRTVINEVFLSIQEDISEADLVDIVNTIMDVSESDSEPEEEEVEFNNDSDVDMDSHSEEEEEEEEEEENEEEDEDQWKEGLNEEEIDEMNKYDEKIISYLTLKKEMKKEQAQNSLNNTNYKLKLLELIEKFIDKNTDNFRTLPLVHLLAQTFSYIMKEGKEQTIIDRLKHIYKHKLCKNKLKLDKDLSDDKKKDLLEQCYNGLYSCILLCIQVPKNSFISHEIIEFTCFGINYYFNIISFYLDPTLSIKENKEHYVDIMRLKEMFDITLYDYFSLNKNHVKLYFFKYITGRYPLLIHFLLFTLSQYVLHCKNLYSQYEALTVINMIIQHKSIYSQNSSSIYVQTCLSYLASPFEFIQNIINEKDKYKDMTKGIRIKALNTFVKLYNNIVSVMKISSDMKEIIEKREPLDVTISDSIDIQKLREQEDSNAESETQKEVQPKAKQPKQKKNNNKQKKTKEEEPAQPVKRSQDEEDSPSSKKMKKASPQKKDKKQ